MHLFFYLTEMQAPQSFQLVPVSKQHDARDDRSIFSLSNTDGAISFRIIVNPMLPVSTSNDASSQAAIVIPPSSSDLSESEVSAPTARSTFNINLNLGCPVTATFNETLEEIAIIPSASTDSENEMQFKSTASFADLVEKGVDFEEQDDYDRIRISSARMSLKLNDAPLKIDHRRSFRTTIDKVEWFRAGKRPCPRGGWLTRMAKGDEGDVFDDETSTPVSGMYRTTNGFTFQC